GEFSAIDRRPAEASGRRDGDDRSPPRRPAQADQGNPREATCVPLMLVDARSHALRGNEWADAPRHRGRPSADAPLEKALRPGRTVKRPPSLIVPPLGTTQSVGTRVPTQSVGTRSGGRRDRARMDSSMQESAVDRQNLAGDVAGLIRNE